MGNWDIDVIMPADWPSSDILKQTADTVPAMWYSREFITCEATLSADRASPKEANRLKRSWTAMARFRFACDSDLVDSNDESNLVCEPLQNIMPDHNDHPSSDEEGYL